MDGTDMDGDWSFLDEFRYHCGLPDNVPTLRQFVDYIRADELPPGFEDELTNERHNPYKIEDLLKPNADSGVTALHCACAAGCLDNAQFLAELGASIQTNKHGNTPLHWAAQNGHDNVVQWLFEKYPNLDVLQKNAFGRSALAMAFESQSEGCVAAVLNHDSAAQLVPEDEREEDRLDMESYRQQAS